MSKFIRIKNYLVNIEKVQEFSVVGKEILVYYEGEAHARRIACDKCQEAQLIFEDIPHLIDNTYIPQWVREASEPIPCKPEYFNPDYGYDELPF
jgi:hypothetical protein